MYLKSIVLIYLTTAVVFGLPVDNTINSPDTTLIDNDLKAFASVDQALNSANKVLKLEETTTSGQVLFNNEAAPDEDKLFKLNDDDLIENLSPASKQQTQGGMPNVQNLIDQTNTIGTNLETMIKDMTASRRHATAAVFKLMLQNVRRLNTSLVRLNNRVNYLTGTSGGSSPAGSTASSSASSSSASAASSVSTSVSNATINAATQINGVVNGVRNQLNTLNNQITDLVDKVRQSMPGSGANKPQTTHSSKPQTTHLSKPQTTHSSKPHGRP